MFKNVATTIALFAFDSTTGVGKTGDAANITAYVSKDYGAVTVLADTSAAEMDATNAKGWYTFSVAQAETNADALLFSGKSSTSNIQIVACYVHTTPNRFTTLVINTAGSVPLVSNFKINTALPAFEFIMTDSTDHNPATGKTVTVTRSIDGAAFGASANSPSEVSAGSYSIDLAAGDLNGRVIMFKASATGCDDAFWQIVTSPAS